MISGRESGIFDRDISCRPVRDAFLPNYLSRLQGDRVIRNAAIIL